NGGLVQLDQTYDGKFQGDIQSIALGKADMWKAGAGTITFLGEVSDQSFNLLEGGIVADADKFKSDIVDSAAGTSLTLTFDDDAKYDGFTMGDMDVKLNGTGTLRVTDALYHSGTTDLLGGRLVLEGASGLVFNSMFTVHDGATLDV